MSIYSRDREVPLPTFFPRFYHQLIIRDTYKHLQKFVQSGREISLIFASSVFIICLLWLLNCQQLQWLSARPSQFFLKSRGSIFHLFALDYVCIIFFLNHGNICPLFTIRLQSAYLIYYFYKVNTCFIFILLLRYVCLVV